MRGRGEGSSQFEARGGPQNESRSEQNETGRLLSSPCRRQQLPNEDGESSCGRFAISEPARIGRSRLSELQNLRLAAKWQSAGDGELGDTVDHRPGRAFRVSCTTDGTTSQQIEAKAYLLLIVRDGLTQPSAG